jgi:hypothetical protein
MDYKVSHYSGITLFNKYMERLSTFYISITFTFTRD